MGNNNNLVTEVRVFGSLAGNCVAVFLQFAEMSTVSLGEPLQDDDLLKGGNTLSALSATVRVLKEDFSAMFNWLSSLMCWILEMSLHGA